MTDLLEPDTLAPGLLVHVEEDALVERAEPDGDGRRVLIRLLRWGETTANTQEGVTERFSRGAFASVDPSTVTIEAQRHGGPIVGIGESIEERDDGAYLWARISQTRDGDDLLTLVRDKVLRAASIVFRPFARGSRQLADGVIERTRVELARVAVLDRGAYKSAAVVAVRQAQEVPMTDEPVAETATEPITEPAAEPEPTPTPEPLMERADTQEAPVTAAAVPAPEPVDLSPLMSRVEGLAGDIAGLSQRVTILAETQATPSLTVPELYSIPTFADYLQRSDDDISDGRGLPDPDGLRAWLAREIADQVTTNNAGVVPPAWIMDVKGIVNLGRPAIAAFGGPQPLPPTGMTVEWPYVGSSNTIIGVQSSQKAEVTSARVDIAKGSANIGTYAGASDVAYQLLRRSSPSYRAAYDRIMLAYWAGVVDAAFCTALLTAGTAATLGWDADTTGQTLKEALFAASVQVETATGAPAEFALCATDVFQNLAKLTAIVPPTPTGNPSNAMGTAHARTLEVNVSGLPLIHARGLTTGNVIVSNRLAAQWQEDGPFSAAAETPTKLGQDIAWYSFGATTAFVPAGIVKLFGPGASGS